MFYDRIVYYYFILPKGWSCCFSCSCGGSMGQSCGRGSVWVRPYKMSGCMSLFQNFPTFNFQQLSACVLCMHWYPIILLPSKHFDGAFLNIASRRTILLDPLEPCLSLGFERAHTMRSPWAIQRRWMHRYFLFHLSVSTDYMNLSAWLSP